MPAWGRTRPKAAAKFPAVVANPGGRKAPVAPARVQPVPLNGWAVARSTHPNPRDYTQAMPRKMRQAALRSALSVKAADAGIVVLDELTLPEPKTRLMAQALQRLVGDASALILIPEKNADYELVIRSTNNLPDAKTLLANYLNIRDLLGYDKLILPLPALDVLKSYLG